MPVRIQALQDVVCHWRIVLGSVFVACISWGCHFPMFRVLLKSAHELASHSKACVAFQELLKGVPRSLPTHVVLQCLPVVWDLVELKVSSVAQHPVPSQEKKTCEMLCTDFCVATGLVP
eukprot:3863884-Amphidinium_carterae.1